MIYLHYISEKHTQHYRLLVEEEWSDFSNFWYEYSWHSWTSNDHSSSHLT